MLDFFIQAFSSTLNNFSNLFGNNYFFAIVLLTLIIRLIVLPLGILQEINYKNTETMIEAFKTLLKDEKLVNNKQALFIKMVPIYENAKVRPFFGNILPATIQLVILFSLFYAIRLNESIASFKFLWFTLGETDALYILPFIYLILSLLYTHFFSELKKKTLPMITTVIFFLISFTLPSTIVVYWIIGVLFSILFSPITKHYVNKKKKSSE